LAQVKTYGSARSPFAPLSSSLHAESMDNAQNVLALSCHTCRATHWRSAAELAYITAFCDVCYEQSSPFYILPCRHGVCTACIERMVRLPRWDDELPPQPQQPVAPPQVDEAPPRVVEAPPTPPEQPAVPPQVVEAPPPPPDLQQRPVWWGVWTQPYSPEFDWQENRLQWISCPFSYHDITLIDVVNNDLWWGFARPPPPLGVQGDIRWSYNSKRWIFTPAR
jgi:hypothetical protein